MELYSFSDQDCEAQRQDCLPVPYVPERWALFQLHVIHTFTIWSAPEYTISANVHLDNILSKYTTKYSATTSAPETEAVELGSSSLFCFLFGEVAERKKSLKSVLVTRFKLRTASAAMHVKSSQGISMSSSLFQQAIPIGVVGCAKSSRIG